MLTLAMGLLNHRAAAEDVVQDVFLAFARSAQDLRPQGSLRSYLATSVLNRVRDNRRQQRRQAARDVEGPVAREAAGPERSVILAEETDRLHQAIAQLPDDQREVVLLRLKANLKFRDIAKVQRTSLNTVLGRYRYGLDRLRSLLNGEVEK
jgi:RNA polymerase sigma factor (sigma-70 family)